MSNKEIITEYARLLNSFTDSNQIREYYLKTVPTIGEDLYNHMVFLMTMCVNKELHLALSKDDNYEDEDYPYVLNDICQQIEQVYKAHNKSLVKTFSGTKNNRRVLLHYLDRVLNNLLSGVRYYENPDSPTWGDYHVFNEVNSRYRREERLRDNMKMLLTSNKADDPDVAFTYKHNIEIPFMYVLCWDLDELYDHFQDDVTYEPADSYIGNLKKNTSIELKYISDFLSDVMIQGNIKTTRVLNPDSIVTPIEVVSFRNLLPTITVVEKIDDSNDLKDKSGWAKAKKNHTSLIIKKEALKKRPLLPFEIPSKNYYPQKSLRMMVDLLCEENKTKEYLNSDIVAMKEIMISIVQKVLYWIDKGIIQPSCKRPDKVSEYLRDIKNSVENVPRKNSKELRNNYLSNVTKSIINQWTKENIYKEYANRKNIDSYVRYSYFSVLKHSRNWDAHLLLKNPSMAFASFIFCISMRYILKLEKLSSGATLELYNDYLKEEAKLFPYIYKDEFEYHEDVDDLTKKYEYIISNVENYLKEFADPKELKNIKDRKRPHELLRLVGESSSKLAEQISEYEIFLTFHMAIHFGYGGKDYSLKKDGHDFNLLSILGRTESYMNKSFLLKPIQLISNDNT